MGIEDRDYMREHPSWDVPKRSRGVPEHLYDHSLPRHIRPGRRYRLKPLPSQPSPHSFWRQPFSLSKAFLICCFSFAGAIVLSRLHIYVFILPLPR